MSSADPAYPADPIGAWLQAIADRHAAARHGRGPCLGSVGLIDPAARLRGVAAVRQGNCLSLERPVQTGPDESADGHGKPSKLDVKVSSPSRMVAGMDQITIDVHGTGDTHLDGIAHIGVDGQWHDNVPAESVYTDDDSLLTWARHGIATRGVLIDIPAVRGAEWVTPEEPVTGDEIQAGLDATGVTFEPGDGLLLYMGRDRFEAAGHVYPTGGTVVNGRSGVGSSGAEWIADHDPGLVCWDFHDAKAGEERSLEVHLLIWAIGLCLVDNCDLGPAADALRTARTATGLLTASPLAIRRSTGSLVNPLLIY